MAKESIYAVYKDGKYIGNYKALQLHEKLGINLKTLYGYVNKGISYKRHYTFCRVSPDGSTPLQELSNEEFCMEWDRWRKLLNPDAV